MIIPSTNVIDTPIADPHPKKVLVFITTVCLILFQLVSHIFTIAVLAIREYYPRVAFGEAGVVMPYSTLNFIINALLAFIEIKAQDMPGFPFQTHPHAIMCSVTSLLMYGLATVAELVVSTAGLDRTSIYAIVVHLAKIGSLCILVASLASLFYI